MRVSKTGPKPEYSTPRKIEDKINAFFAVCEEEGDTFPSYMSMLLFMQLTEKDVEALCAEANENHERNREAFTKAAMHREAWLCEHMANAANAKSITAASIKASALLNFVIFILFLHNDVVFFLFS